MGGYRPRSFRKKALDSVKTAVVVLALIILVIAWIAVSMVDGCPDYDDNGNVRSGSSGHSRSYSHGGKY